MSIAYRLWKYNSEKTDNSYEYNKIVMWDGVPEGLFVFWGKFLLWWGDDKRGAFLTSNQNRLYLNSAGISFCAEVVRSDAYMVWKIMRGKVTFLTTYVMTIRECCPS